MKHWEPYLKKSKLPRASLISAGFSACMAVVIPCYNEPNLEATLQSLRECASPACGTLVIVVINSSENCSAGVVRQNRESFSRVQAFSQSHSNDKIHFMPLLCEELPRKHAGVGLARKIGMDLAVDYFLRTENPRGILVSLDADCIVSPNFLVGIFESFRRDEKLCCTIHNFYHRVENDDPTIEAAVRQYETYLSYFENALRYTGFPYYYHTIGSAFAVTADAYVRVGGMGRQQGGEDFYFLQKIFQMGKTKELDDVMVYPMARFSDRVPFGTGPALQKIIAQKDGLMKVYDFEAFQSLRQFFDMKDSFYGASQDRIIEMIRRLHPMLQEFLTENNFLLDIQDCNANAATLKSFQKRFFHHFNAFKIIKYLNFAHQNAFGLTSLTTALDKYSEAIGS
jgi:glycosyltransferase involved in cell wall biosynthesis